MGMYLAFAIYFIAQLKLILAGCVVTFYIKF